MTTVQALTCRRMFNGKTIENYSIVVGLEIDQAFPYNAASRSGMAALG